MENPAIFSLVLKEPGIKKKSQKYDRSRLEAGRNGQENRCQFEGLLLFIRPLHFALAHSQTRLGTHKTVSVGEGFLSFTLYSHKQLCLAIRKNSEYEKYDGRAGY